MTEEILQREQNLREAYVAGEKHKQLEVEEWLKKLSQEYPIWGKIFLRKFQTQFGGKK